MDVAEDIHTVANEEIVGQALCATWWKSSSRSLGMKDVIQAIESLKDQRFDVTGLESLVTIMQRKVESLIFAGHNRHGGMGTAIEFQRSAVPVVAETLEDEYEWRLENAYTMTAVNSKQLDMLLWKALFIEPGGVHDGESFTQILGKLISKIAATQDSINDMLGPAPITHIQNEV